MVMPIVPAPMMPPPQGPSDPTTRAALQAVIAHFMSGGGPPGPPSFFGGGIPHMPPGVHGVPDITPMPGEGIPHMPPGVIGGHIPVDFPPPHPPVTRGYGIPDTGFIQQRPSGPQISFGPPGSEGGQIHGYGPPVLVPSPVPRMPPGGPPFSVGPPIHGVNQTLHSRLVGLFSAVREHGGDLYVFSGSREPEHQAQMYQDAIRKYGDEKTARRYVSPAGESHHDPNAGMRHGLGPGAIGVDLRGDLAIAHQLASHYGLAFDNKESPWHISVAGLK